MTSVQYSLLPIRARGGIGRTWAVCHALLMGGTTDEVLQLAEALYQREASKRGWDPVSQISAYRNFGNYVTVLSRHGVEAAQDTEGIWHARMST